MYFFLHRFLSVFLWILAILARFWEAPGAQKIAKNRKKRFRDAFETRLEFWCDFWSDFIAIFIDF